MTNAETNTAAAVAAQGAHVAPEKAASKKAASQKKGAPKANQGAKKAASQKRRRVAKQAATTKHIDLLVKQRDEEANSKKASKAKEAAVPREFSKKNIVLELLRRPTGATLPGIMAAVGWQAHSVRGFISTTAKKNGIKIESSKNEAGERVYKLAK